MRTPVLLAAAGVAEIAGCFIFWAVLRLKASPVWLAPGVLSLLLFAWLLTWVEVACAGRAYAIYGGIYIAASPAWLWAVEGRAPDKRDLAKAAICIAGALVISTARVGRDPLQALTCGLTSAPSLVKSWTQQRAIPDRER